MVRKGGQLEVHARSTWGRGGSKKAKKWSTWFVYNPSCRRLQNQFNLIFTIILIGLGKEVTKELAKLETSKVYMLCRNMEKCEMTRRNIVTETKNK